MCVDARGRGSIRTDVADSGGPLLVEVRVGRRYKLIGIVSGYLSIYIGLLAEDALKVKNYVYARNLMVSPTKPHCQWLQKKYDCYDVDWNGSVGLTCHSFPNLVALAFVVLYLFIA